MRCQTKDDFDALSTLLADLIVAKHGNHPLYAMFVNKLVVDVAAPLKDVECRKAASGLTTLSNAKQAEAKAGKGKGKKGGKPALGASKTVGGGRADTSTYEEAMDDGDYDDFVSRDRLFIEVGTESSLLTRHPLRSSPFVRVSLATCRCRYAALVLRLQCCCSKPGLLVSCILSTAIGRLRGMLWVTFACLAASTLVLARPARVAQRQGVSSCEAIRWAGARTSELTWRWQCPTMVRSTFVCSLTTEWSSGRR